MHVLTCTPIALPTLILTLLAPRVPFHTGRAHPQHPANPPHHLHAAGHVLGLLCGGLPHLSQVPCKLNQPSETYQGEIVDDCAVLINHP